LDPITLTLKTEAARFTEALVSTCNIIRCQPQTSKPRRPQPG